MILINNDCRSFNFCNIKNPVIVTDPPFNIGYHYKDYKDKMPEQEYYEFLKDIIGDRPAVIIHYPESICRLSIELQKAPQRVVSWVYNSNTAKQHRDIAFFDITPDFRQVKQPYKNPNDKRIRERIARGIEGGGYMTGGTLTRLKTFQKINKITLVRCR